MGLRGCVWGGSGGWVTTASPPPGGLSRFGPSPSPPPAGHLTHHWYGEPGQDGPGVHPAVSSCPSLLSLPAIKFPRIVGVSKYPCPGSGGPVLCSCPTPALTLASEPGPLPVEALQPGSPAWGSLASLPQGAKSSKQPGVVGGETGKQVFPTQAGTGASRLPSAPAVCLDLSSMNSRGR